MVKDSDKGIGFAGPDTRTKIGKKSGLLRTGQTGQIETIKFLDAKKSIFGLKEYLQYVRDFLLTSSEYVRTRTWMACPK